MFNMLAPSRPRQEIDTPLGPCPKVEAPMHPFADPDKQKKNAEAIFV